MAFVEGLSDLTSEGKQGAGGLRFRGDHVTCELQPINNSPARWEWVCVGDDRNKTLYATQCWSVVEQVSYIYHVDLEYIPGSEELNAPQRVSGLKSCRTRVRLS